MGIGYRQILQSYSDLICPQESEERNGQTMDGQERKCTGDKMNGKIVSVESVGNDQEIIFSDERHNQYSLIVEKATIFVGDGIKIGGKMYALITNDNGETKKITRHSLYRKVEK